MKKILVPTDFSTEASYALAVANEIASQYNFAEITLLHVIEVPTAAKFNTTADIFANADDEVFFIKMMEKVKKDLAALVEEERRKGVNIHSKVKIGHTYNSIAEEIATEEVDLIIMGSKGATGMKEILMGSNAEKVVRFAKCPVITVKAKPRNYKIRDIVFASDFQEDIDSIHKLKELQEIFFAKLHLLYINTPTHFQTSADVKSRIEAFINKYDLSNCTINTYDALSEEEGIVEFGKSVQADVIALATHKRQGILRFIKGSISEDVVNHSKSVIFTMPLREKV